MKLLNHVKKYGSQVMNKTTAAYASVSTALLGFAQSAKAELDTSASGTLATGIADNYSAGQDVGVYVIMGVIGLVLIGIVISMVRK